MSSPTGRKVRLLRWLRGLLENSAYSDIIIWTNEATSEFKMISPHKVAELWGIETGNGTMNYDKMSRALRYLYNSNTLVKVPGKDSRYRFIDAPTPYRSNNYPFWNDAPINAEPLANFNIVPLIKTESLFNIKREPVSNNKRETGFNIANLLSDSDRSPGSTSLQSSPTSSSSSAEPSSPPSSGSMSSDEINIIATALSDPLQWVQLLQNFQQFNVFISQYPAFKAFDVPTQIQFFFNFKKLLSAAVPTLPQN